MTSTNKLLRLFKKNGVVGISLAHKQVQNVKKPAQNGYDNTAYEDPLTFAIGVQEGKLCGLLLSSV